MNDLYNAFRSTTMSKLGSSRAGALGVPFTVHRIGDDTIDPDAELSQALSAIRVRN